MAYYILQNSPIVAVKQTDTEDAPGVTFVPPMGGKACSTPDGLVVVSSGDYIVIDSNGNKRVVPQKVFEQLFKEA